MDFRRMSREKTRHFWWKKENVKRENVKRENVKRENVKKENVKRENVKKYIIIRLEVERKRKRICFDKIHRNCQG